MDRLNGEIVELKYLVDSLVRGWSYSLEFADSVYNMSVAMCLSVYSGFGLVGSDDGGMLNT